jgi:hypothetical protein
MATSKEVEKTPEEIEIEENGKKYSLYDLDLESLSREAKRHFFSIL